MINFVINIILIIVTERIRIACSRQHWIDRWIVTTNGWYWRLVYIATQKQRERERKKDVKKMMIEIEQQMKNDDIHIRLKPTLVCSISDSFRPLEWM